MKRLKLFFACLLMAVLSIGQMWGADPEWSGTVAKVDNNGDQTMNGVTWTITSDNTSGLGQAVNATKGAQIGSGSKPTKSLTFVTSGIPGTIKKVVVNTSGASGFSGTVSVAVGSTNFLCNSAVTASVSTSATDYTFEGSASGTITISWAQTTSKAIYVKTISVTYQEGSCTSEITITKGDNPANGTFVIDNSGAVCIDEGNATVNVTATPNAGYHLATVTSTVGTVGDIDGNNCAITNISANTTINVTFAANPKYTVSFNVGGSSASQADITEESAGAGITLPAGPTPTCSADGWVFAGWAAAAVASETTTAPTLLSGTYHPTEDCTLFAVYKRTEAGSGSTTKSMTSFDAISGNVENDANVSYAAAQGTSSTAPAVNSEQIRIYQNGGLLTITANNGVKLNSITIGSGMVTKVTYAVDGGAASGDNDIAKNGTFTVDELDATEVVFTCTGADKNSRLYLNNLSVTYSGGGTTYYLSAPSCSCEPLDAPSVTVTNKTYNGAKLTWAAVANAAKYVVKFNGEDHEVTNNYYDATGLTPSTQYTYQVKALAAANQDDYCDSEFSTEANFTTEVAPNATLTLMENGNEVDGGSHAILTPFALPTEVSHTCTKVFVGWDADPDCATAPTYAPGANFTFANTTGVTLYAVYAEAGDATYNKTAFADLASGDAVVVTMDNGVVYAMSNSEFIDSKGPKAIEVTVSENAITSTVTDAIVWNITFDESNFSLTKKGSTDKLYCTNTNNGVRVGSGEANTFSINNSYIYTSATSDARYLGVYNSQDFRCYTSINSNIENQTLAFYKAVVAYSNYATTCVEALAAPTFNETAGTYTEAKSIVLSADEGDIHYTTNGDDPDENSPVYSTAIALNDCGSTTIKAIAVDGARISEIAEATYVIKLPIDANTEEGAYTAAQAKAIIDEDCDLTSQQVYVKGTVQTPTYYSSSHTYNITLAGEEGFQFYKLYDLNGAEFTSDYIKAGDQIVAYGYLKKHNATYELDQNCYLVSYEAYTEPKTDIDNTIDNPWTVAQADGFMDAPAQYDLGDVVFVKGFVTGFATDKVIIRDTENGEEYIELYKSTLADGISALIVGDLIIATGTLEKYKGTTYQMKTGCQVVWKKAKATIEIADINMEVGDEIELSSISATITPEAAENATINYEVTAGTAVSISEGKIIAEAAGEATITASIATTEDYIGASKEITVTVTAPDTRKVANASAFEAISGDMTPADIAFAAYKGDGTTTPVINSSNIRLYKPATGKNTGSYLTLTAKVGCTIDQVKITFAANATAAYSVDDAALPTEAFITGQTELLTSAGLNAQSVSVVNLKNGSIDVSEIKVWYTGDALPVHHYILGGTYETVFEQFGTFSYDGLTVTAAYDELETITEAVTGFTVEADLSTAGEKKADVMLNSVKIAEYDITVTESPKEDPALAYDPTSVILTKGDALSAPTFSNTYGVAVSYESDNEAVATVDAEGNIALAGGVGTAVITASFAGNEDYIESEATFTITVNAPAEDLSGTWVVATSVAAGDRIIIADVAEAGVVYTMGEQANNGTGNNRVAVESAVDEYGVLTPTAGTKTFLVVDVENGEFALQALNGNYLYAASGSSNHLKETSDIDNVNAKWTITIENGIATIKALHEGHNSRNWMRKNESSAIFSCYGSGQNDIVIYKHGTPDYGSYPRTGLTEGDYGTICLPKAGVISGAKLFEIAYKGDGLIYCDEILSGEMEAGVPYIFQATANQLNVAYSNGNAPVAASDANGLYGFYDLENMATDEAAHKDLTQDAGNYILYNNQYWLVSGRAAYINNFRAYIKLDEISTSEPTPTPGAAPRRRVAMTVNGAQTATGMDELNASEAPVKVIIDGQLFIIRGEQMFNANGQLVK